VSKKASHKYEIAFFATQCNIVAFAVR